MSEEWQLLMETPVKDPLKFEVVEHDRTEWDNIPPIVVRMCLNLNRYMQSTIAFMGQKHYEIRALQHDVAVIPGQMKQMRAEIDAEFGRHQDQLDDIKANIATIYKEIEAINMRHKAEKEALDKAALDSMDPLVTVANDKQIEKLLRKSRFLILYRLGKQR